VDSNSLIRNAQDDTLKIMVAKINAQPKRKILIWLRKKALNLIRNYQF